MPPQKHAFLLPSRYVELMGLPRPCSVAAYPHPLLCLSAGARLPAVQTDLTRFMTLAEKHRSLLLQLLTRFSVSPGEL